MNTTRTNDDPLSIRYELGVALAGYEDAPSPTAAFAVAATLGKTRLFGVNPGDLDGRLTPELAIAAADGLDAALPAWFQAVRKLDPGYEDQWRTEGDEDCIALLENRMDTWGAFVAIRESAETRPELKPVAERVTAMIQKFDRRLRSQEEELSSVAGLPLLSNWKALLAPSYREPLPWWLDGTLEATATRVRQAAMAASPSASVWRLIATKALFPPLVSESMADPVAAAADEPSSPGGVGCVLQWASPDGRWRARLNLPATSNQTSDHQLRPVNIRSTDSVALPLPEGTPVRLGPIEGKIEASGQLKVTIAALRRATDLELHVSGEAWPLVAHSPNIPGERL